MKKIIFLLILLFYSTQTYCSILTILQDGDDEINIQRPILLSGFSDKQKLYLSYTYENIYKLKGTRGIIDSAKSYNTKLTLYTPVYNNKNFDISLGYDNYYSTTPLFISSEIKDTNLNFSGIGYSAGISIFYKNFGLGLFNASSDIRGKGTSKHLTDNITLLSKDAILQINVDDFEKGIQYGYKNNNTFISYQKNKFNFKVKPKIYDKDDDFTFPIENKGKSYEYLLSRKIEDNKEVQFCYQNGKGSGKTNYYYNNTPTLGKNFLYSKYKLCSVSYLKDNKIFSYENYSSDTNGYGIIEPIGMFFGIIGGWHIYEHSEKIKYSKFDYGFKREKGSIAYNLKFSIAPVEIKYKIHCVQKLFLGIVTIEKVNMDDKLKMFLIQLNPKITKKIKKGFLVHFDISQAIPIISKETKKKTYIEEMKRIERAKPSGGTLFKLSLEYSL
jgi:hypothetical protein